MAPKSKLFIPGFIVGSTAVYLMVRTMFIDPEEYTDKMITVFRVIDGILGFLLLLATIMYSSPK